jgi:hypothetical protein
MSLTATWLWGDETAGKSSSCVRVVPRPAQIQLDGSIGQWYNGCEGYIWYPKLEQECQRLSARQPAAARIRLQLATV